MREDDSQAAFFGPADTPGDPAGDPARRRKMFFALLRGRWAWAISFAVILGGVGAYFGFNMQGKLYTASARVWLEAGRQFANVDLEETERGERNYTLFVEEQVTLVIPSGRYAQDALDSDAWQDFLNDPERPRDVPASPGEFLSGVLEVQPPERKKVEVLFQYMSPHPATARAGANAAAQGYKTYFDRQKQKQYENKAVAIRLVIQDLETRVDALDDEVLKVLAGRSRESLDLELATAIDEAQAINRDRLNLQTRVGGAPTASDDPDVQLTRPEIIASDPVAGQVYARIQGVNAEMDVERRNGRGENHPVMKRLRAQLESLQNALEQQIQLVQGGGDPLASPGAAPGIDDRVRLANLERKLNRAQERQEALLKKRNQIQELDAERVRLNDRIVDEQLRLDAEEAKEKQQEAQLATDQVRVMGKAALPKKPSNTMARIQFAVLLGGAGVFLSFGGVLLLGMMDGRMRYAADAAVRLGGARMLGVLPTLPRKFKNREQADKAAHAVHRIRTLLQIGRGGQPDRVYTVTSPAAGSGKSSLSVALGLSFASSGARTLLVDGDVVGAGLSRRLGTVVHHPLERLVEQRGVTAPEVLDAAVSHAQQSGRPLAEVLAERGIVDARTLQSLVKEQRKSSVGLMDAVDALSLTGCVATTEVRNLYVLPVGDARPADAGNLSPKGIAALIDQARDEFDVVVIDTGPILGSIEASMAASASDGVIMVVSRGDSKGLSMKAMNHLHSIDAPVLGVVFNHASEDDMTGSSYGSVMSKKRFDAGPPRPLPAFNPRFGPLGSAVVADVSAEDDPFNGVTHDLDAADRAGGFDFDAQPGAAAPANGRAGKAPRRAAGRSR
ncbi:MAG: AAA family ATPase [Planctomycetota bacterium]